MFRDTQDFSSFWSELTQLGSCGWFTFVGTGVFNSRRVPGAEGRIERKMEPGDSRGDLSMSIDSGGGVLLASVSGRFTLSRGVEALEWLARS